MFIRIWVHNGFVLEIESIEAENHLTYQVKAYTIIEIIPFLKLLDSCQIFQPFSRPYKSLRCYILLNTNFHNGSVWLQRSEK